MATLKIYKAKVNLLMNGKTIAPGETVELDKATAERMSAVIELTADVEAKAKTESDAKENQNNADIHIDLVVAAIGELDVNDDNYTKGGKPDAVVLSDKLNGVVSAKLRDKAWTIYQKSHHANMVWDVYAQAVGGKTFDGKDLPDFDDLGEQQKGWLAVSQITKLEGLLQEQAKTCWDVYAQAVGGKTFDGKDLPDFDDLGEQQKGWLAVADFINA